MSQAESWPGLFRKEQASPRAPGGRIQALPNDEEDKEGANLNHDAGLIP